MINIINQFKVGDTVTTKMIIERFSRKTSHGHVHKTMQQFTKYGIFRRIGNIQRLAGKRREQGFEIVRIPERIG